MSATGAKLLDTALARRQDPVIAGNGIQSMRPQLID